LGHGTNDIPPKGWGAVESLIWTYYQGLTALGHYVSIVNTMNNDVIVGYLNTHPWDIIHIHDYLYFSKLTAFLFAKNQKKRLIITQHIGFIPYNNPLFRWLLSFLNATLGGWILRHADQTIFISDVVQKYFSEKIRFGQPALLIPNGVETSIFFPIDERDRLNHRQHLNLPLEQPIFLFVGRFVEKKGLLILRALTQQFPDIYWLFAGWGSLNPSSWQLPNVRVFSNLQSGQLTFQKPIQ
jgi:glycosyltransferase involved in cell wall biosynthesis